MSLKFPPDGHNFSKDLSISVRPIRRIDRARETRLGGSATLVVEGVYA